MFRRHRFIGLVIVTAFAATLFGNAQQSLACGSCTRTEPACAAPCEQVRLLPGYFICETKRVCISPGYWRTINTPPVSRVCYDICGRPYTQVVSAGTCRREWIPPVFENRTVRKWVAPQWERVNLGPQCAPTPFQGYAVQPNPLKQRAPRPRHYPTPVPHTSYKHLAPPPAPIMAAPQPQYAPAPAPAPALGCHKCKQKQQRGCKNCAKNPWMHQPGDNHNHDHHQPRYDDVPEAEPASFMTIDDQPAVLSDASSY